MPPLGVSAGKEERGQENREIFRNRKINVLNGAKSGGGRRERGGGGGDVRLDVSLVYCK